MKLEILERQVDCLNVIKGVIALHGGNKRCVSVYAGVGGQLGFFLHRQIYHPDFCVAIK